MIFRTVPTFNVDPATVALHELLGDKQPNACAYRSSGREESVEYLWQIIGSDTNAIVLNGQTNTIL